MKNNAYNSFVFHGSYYDMLQMFDRETRIRLYEAIILFSLTGLEPDFDEDSVIYRAWKEIRSQVEINNKYDLR